MDNNIKLKTREKVFYGLGDLGNNIAYGAVGFYFVFFLTDVAGISPVWAGYIFMISRICNAISDLLMGVISDHTKSKFGRRRPYLLFGAIPLGIGFSLLWIVPFQGTTQLIIYYTLIGMVFNILYSLVSIPYNSLLPELSQDYDERTSISGYKMAFSFIGSLLSAMGATLIVDILYGGKSMYTVSFPVMGRVMAVILIVTILLAFIGTKERVEPKFAEKQEGLWKNLKSLLKLKEYRMVLGVFIFNMISFDVIMALYIYYMKYALKISDSLSSVFMAIPLVAAVIVTPMWVSISNKIGKKKTYIISSLYFLVPLFACIFVPANNLPITVLVTVLVGVGISASQVLVFSILPDVVEVDEMKNGVRREGVIYGTTMLLYKIFSAIFVALVTASMGWFGYVESVGNVAVTQTDGAIMGIRLLMGLVPAFCLIISVLAIWKLPIAKEDFDKIKESVDQNA